MGPRQLEQVFRRLAPGPAPAELGERLATLCAAARAERPAIGLADEVFVAWVAERVAGADDVGRALDQLAVDDLWIACGCAGGDAAAVAALEERLAPIGRTLARTSGAGELVDEALQRLREKLLVRQPPKIAGYRGKGPLGGWLRVAATRELVSLRRRAPAAGPLDEADRLASPISDPEVAHLRQLYSDHFRRAFAAAMATLSVRERNLLRYQVLDRLRLEDIAALHGGVHHVTVARWLADARRKLLEATRRQMREALRVTPTELQSVLRLLPSQLDVSVRRLLEEPDGGG